MSLISYEIFIKKKGKRIYYVIYKKIEFLHYRRIIVEFIDLQIMCIRLTYISEYRIENYSRDILKNLRKFYFEPYKF